MTTFKKLADQVRAFDRDEKGAAGSIEQVGGVAVAALILAIVYKMADKKIIPAVQASVLQLISGGTAGGGAGGAAAGG